MSQQQFLWLGLSLQQPSLVQHLPMNLEIWSWKDVIRSSIWSQYRNETYLSRNETYSEVAKKVEFIKLANGPE